MTDQPTEFGDENTVRNVLIDGNDLYGVPEDEQLDYDEPEDPDSYGGEPEDLSDVEDGEALFLGDD